MRLKEQVQACHIRFLTFSSARTEQNVLLLLHENQARTHQLDGLVSQMLLRNDNEGVLSLRGVDGSIPGVEMFDYLSEKIRHTLIMVDGFIARPRDWDEDPNQWHIQPFISSIEDEPSSASTLFNTTFFSMLKIMQSLTRDPPTTSSQDLASNLTLLAWGLEALNRNAETTSVISAAARIYSHLFEGSHSDLFLEHLADALDTLSVYSEDTAEALKASGEATIAWTQLYHHSSSYNHARGLSTALGIHSKDLLLASRSEEALEYSRQCLLIARQIPIIPQVGGKLVQWEGSGEAGVVFTSQRIISRTADTAYIEMYALYRYASDLGTNGHYAEAVLTGLEAIGCHQALIQACPESPHVNQWSRGLAILQSEAPSWVSMTLRPSDRPLIAAEVRRRGQNRIRAQRSLALIPSKTS
ncbi:hypothetical protein HGRIS_011419 [Hohenbuehelia grisea]